ncbi:hypothetical protein [Candidatus Chlorohelix sp.]|uniref:hypothetical protein n=1 Tax=Candidatus Chlorohelix sp. TaxID=3139201 RepID=UPI003021619A
MKRLRKIAGMCGIAGALLVFSAYPLYIGIRETNPLMGFAAEIFFGVPVIIIVAAILLEFRAAKTEGIALLLVAIPSLLFQCAFLSQVSDGWSLPIVPVIISLVGVLLLLGGSALAFTAQRQLNRCTYS